MKTENKLPEDWEEIKLEFLVQPLKGKRPSSFLENNVTDALPYLSAEYLREGGEPFWANREKQTTSVKKGQILLLWDGSNAGEFFIANEEGILSSTMAKFNLKTNINELFLFYLLKTKEIFLKSMCRGTGIPHVDKNILNKLPLTIPKSLEEQKAIAKILSTVDEAIEKTDKVIEKVERAKRGVIKNQLEKNPRKRIILDEETIDLKNGLNFSKDEKGKGTLTVDVFNMYGPRIYLDFSRLYRISRKIPDEYYLKKGDILFVRSSLKREGAAWATMFDGYPEPVSFCGFIIRGRLRRGDLNPSYLVYYLRSNEARRSLIGSAGTVGVTNISQGSIRQLKVPLPPPSEQQKIVNILSTIDQKLENEKKRKGKLESVKKGLMQDLLTGKKRVNVNNILEVGK